MISLILQYIRRLREAFVDLWTGGDRSRMQSDTEDLHTKLSDLKWVEDNTDDSIQKTRAERTQKDMLADTVFQARPGNPLSDDF